MFGSRVQLLNENGDVITCDAVECILLAESSRSDNGTLFILQSPEKLKGISIIIRYIIRYVWLFKRSSSTHDQKRQ